MSRRSDPDPCYDHKLRYVDPATGDHAIPNIATLMQLLLKGFETARYRSSDSTVLVIVEGEGETQAGDTTFRWRRHDVIVARPGRISLIAHTARR